MLDSQSIAVMQMLSNNLAKFSQNIEAYFPAMSPILEINALSQVCSNQKLSEEVRSIAAARLETVIKQTYGQKYGNDISKQFK